jgi:DNA-binding transcriptional MocR family regulator
MTVWLPDIETRSGPIPRRILEALEADIASGALAPGTRLPTQRSLAERLSVGLGTVTKAYAEAEARGLLRATVGRGSFVAGPPARSESGIDLSRNLPPTPHAGAQLAESLSRLRRQRDLQAHLGYPPPAGFEAHRQAAAAWLSHTAHWEGLAGNRVICCAGAQQAIAIALLAACTPGDALLVEAATFSGIKALATTLHYRLAGVAMDGEGALPDALEEAAGRSGARVAYLQPLQNPTARIMGARRRGAIVAVARKCDLLIVEDDLYAAYASDLKLPPLAMLAPERVFYVSGLSKSLTPGLRQGYCIPPATDDWQARCLAALRAIAFGAPGFGGLLAQQWLEDGTAHTILEAHRREFAARAALALELLGSCAETPANASATHLWLPMGELDAERAAAGALRAGVEITPPGANLAPEMHEHGLRVCLGAAADRDALRQGIQVLMRVLNARGDSTLDAV